MPKKADKVIVIKIKADSKRTKKTKKTKKRGKKRGRK